MLLMAWSRRISKAFPDFVFQDEDLRNGDIDEIHGTKQTFYRDVDWDENAIFSHVFSSKAGIPISRLLRLVEQGSKVYIAIRWKGLSHTEETN